MRVLLENLKKKVFRAILFIAVTIIPASLSARDYYVKPKGSGAHTGDNWANAMNNRMFAEKLLSAGSGDVFHLAAGAYVPYFDVNGNEPGNKKTKTFFVRDGVSVRGGYDSRGKAVSDKNKAVAAAHLSGVLEPDNYHNNVYHVVTVADNANNATAIMLQYLTVSDGNANGGGKNSNGAGIYVGENAGATKALRFSHIHVRDNRSNGEGNGIYISRGANVSISHSQITDNTHISSYEVWGGGIGVMRARLTISASHIAGNTADHGGAIHVFAGHLYSHACVYDGNSATSHGGAIDVYDRSKVTSNSDVFTNNTSGEGGAVHNESASDAGFKKCVFRDNIANEGGGFYNSGDCKATIDSCLFEKNAALRRGGGGINNRGTATVKRSRIVGNSAVDGNGGGVNQHGTFVMTQCEVSYNTAKNGAGIYTENKLAQIANTTISGNIATAGGGGICHKYDKCELHFVTITGNTAPKGMGSGILANSRPSIYNSIIAGNSGGNDFNGTNLFETGDGRSENNIINSKYYRIGNRRGENVKFDHAKHLGVLDFNRNAFTRTHALTWTGTSQNNPAAGRGSFDTKYASDQTGVVRNKRYPSLGAYEEAFFKAQNDRMFIDKGFSAYTYDILANDSYSGNCNPKASVSVSSTALAQMVKCVNNSFIYAPRPGVKTGVDTIRYTLECAGGSKDYAFVIVKIGKQYDRPQNIKDEVTCMKDMQPIEFKVRRKAYTSEVQVDGFSAPLVGDLTGDGKPEIVGLGVVRNDGKPVTWLEAFGKSIVIYDGQTGKILLNFELASLGGNRFTDNSGYGTRYGFRLRDNPRHNSYSHLALADLDNDGIGEIVVAETGSGKVYALKPVLDKSRRMLTLRKIWDSNVLHRAPFNADYSNKGANTFGAPVPYISDINGDGIADVIVYNKIYNGQTGKLQLALEELNLFGDPGSSSSKYGKCKKYAYIGRLPGAENSDDIVPAMAINDIDNDGVMEIIAGSKIYKINIRNASSTAGNSYSVINGPESLYDGNTSYYLTDGFTVVADIDGDNVSDVIVVKRHLNRAHFTVYVWDPRKTGNQSLKAYLHVEQDASQGNFSVPFVGDINGRKDGVNISNPANPKYLPEICMTMGRLKNPGKYPITTSRSSNIPDYTSKENTGDDGSKQPFHGHVAAFTYAADVPDPSKRLKLSWLMKHSDISHQTGIVMFDFDADGINELVYRDELALRVISPANKANGYDFIDLKMDETSHPKVIRFREQGITSYTGFECPVVADVNGDGSADIVTFAWEETERLNNSAGCLFIYEAEGESWAPSRPVWNQGIYYPLQINDNLTVPKRPQSTLTEYWSQRLTQSGRTIRPFNGNWIQQPIVRTNNYVPILMTSDPSIRLEDMKITLSTATETKVSIKVENRGEASVNSFTPLTFYRKAIDKKNLITTIFLGRDIYPGEHVTFIYTLKGNFLGEIIYVRLVDSRNKFPAEGYVDCDPSNNVAYSMQVTAVDDYFSLASDNFTYLDVTENDLYHKHITPQVEIIRSPGHGRALVDADTRISYISEPGFQGVDTIHYRIRCTDNNVTVSDEAAVYILVMRPGAREYAACPGAKMLIELNAVPNVTYNWFKTETAGKAFATNTNSVTFYKTHHPEELWVQTVVKGFPDNKFPRFKIDLPLADNCNAGAPSECMVNGTLLFKENFGGELLTDEDVVQNANLPQVKQYTYSTTFANNSYSIRKVSGGAKEWFNINDHTHPKDKTKGYMLQFKASGSPGQFYECQIDDLCEGMELNISAWVASIYRNNVASSARLAFAIEDTDGNTLAKYYTGQLTNGDPSWKNFGFSFIIPQNVSSIVMRILNNGEGTPCFVLDDITIHLCVPQATLSDNGVHEFCPDEMHDFHGKLLDVNNTAPFGNAPAFRLEFRKNKNAAWQAVKTGKQYGAVDTVLTVAITKSGYYRFVVGREDIIDCANCVAASNEIYCHVKDCSGKAVNDRTLVAYNDSAVFDVLENDKYLCERGKLSVFDTVANSGLHLGRLVKNADSTFTYIADRDVAGIDSVDYLIACQGTPASRARVYFFVNKLVPLHYACDGKTVKIGFPRLPDVSYVWYDDPNVGNVVGGVANDSLTVVKGKVGDNGVWWIQPEWKGIIFPRFALALEQADNCGETTPTGCLADGTVLSREDFAASPDGVGRFNRGAGEQIYSKPIDGLCEDTELLFSSWILGTPNTTFNLTFTLEDGLQNIHAQYCTGEVSDNDAKWKSYGFRFRIPKGYSSFVLKIANNSAGSFSMDSVEIRLCSPKIKIEGMTVGDTVVCIHKPFVMKGNYTNDGNPFGDEIVYRWEFRHADSARWTTLDEGDATAPLHVEWPIADAVAANEGYYRLRVGKRGNTGSTNCCASSDSVGLRVVAGYRFPDIRIQLSPLPKRVVNLTSFVDSARYTKTIRWERTSTFVPAIINGTDESTGSVNSGDFAGAGTYTYKYTAASQCGSSESKVYIHVLKNKMPHIPDTVMVCARHESSRTLNLNHILGLELGGVWKYDATVNPDATVADNVARMSPPSKYADALVFDAVNAWLSAPTTYSRTFRGHTNAKIFKFVYSPPTGVFIEKELVIVVVN